MKATGIVRRIDDLGRVVIPKEIRRTMRIREGDPLEIYTTRDGEVIFKKYSLIGGLEEFAAQFCDTPQPQHGLFRRCYRPRCGHRHRRGGEEGTAGQACLPCAGAGHGPAWPLLRRGCGHQR